MGELKFYSGVLFHSKELIPWATAKNGKDCIAGWRPDSKYWLVEGLEVAHRDNPALKLWVTKIIRRTRDINSGEKDPAGNFIYTHVSKIEGVMCHWWQ